MRLHLFSVHSREYVTPLDDHRLILNVFSSHNSLRVCHPEMAHLSLLIRLPAILLYK